MTQFQCPQLHLTMPVLRLACELSCAATIVSLVVSRGRGYLVVMQHRPGCSRVSFLTAVMHWHCSASNTLRLASHNAAGSRGREEGAGPAIELASIGLASDVAATTGGTANQLLTDHVVDVDTQSQAWPSRPSHSAASNLKPLSKAAVIKLLVMTKWHRLMGGGIGWFVWDVAFYGTCRSRRCLLSLLWQHPTPWR